MKKEPDIAALSLNLYPVDKPHRRFLHAWVHTEVAEIVFSDQKLRRPAHLIDIRLFVQARIIFSVEHRLHISVKAGIAVSLTGGVISGMEPRSRLLHLKDSYIIRQVTVQVVPDLLGGKRRIQPCVGNHALRMHAAIRAPCPDDLRLAAAHQPENALQLPLYGILSRLPLPAVISCPIILNHKPVIFHIIRFLPSISSPNNFFHVLLFKVIKIMYTIGIDTYTRKF